MCVYMYMYVYIYIYIYTHNRLPKLRSVSLEAWGSKVPGPSSSQLPQGGCCVGLPRARGMHQ